MRANTAVCSTAPRIHLSQGLCTATKRSQDSRLSSPCPLLPQGKELSALPSFTSLSLSRKSLAKKIIHKVPFQPHLFHCPRLKSGDKTGHLSPHILHCHPVHSPSPQCRGAEPAATLAEQENHPGAHRAQVATEHLPCQPQRGATAGFKAPLPPSRRSCPTHHLDLSKAAQVMQ